MAVVSSAIADAYEPMQAKDCTPFFPDDSEVLYRTEYLFEQSSAIIDGLRPEYEYHVSIKVSTIGGESGFSNFILIPRMFYIYCIMLRIYLLFLCLKAFRFKSDLNQGIVWSVPY